MGAEMKLNGRYMAARIIAGVVVAIIAGYGRFR
jgi:hypothetical protein